MTGSGVKKRKKRKRNPHLTDFLTDMAHFVICACIVVCATVIFLNPVQFPWLFPAVFALASLMQFVHGIPRIITYRRSHGTDNSLLFSGLGLCLAGVVLAGVTAVSLITIRG